MSPPPHPLFSPLLSRLLTPLAGRPQRAFEELILTMSRMAKTPLDLRAATLDLDAAGTPATLLHPALLDNAATRRGGGQLRHAARPVRPSPVSE